MKSVRKSELSFESKKAVGLMVILLCQEYVYVFARDHFWLIAVLI